ncbi:MAG: hypothetical protein Q9160_007515 [Pyrenula sp. 1 TL-2023]
MFDPPYALFVVAEDIDVHFINDTLVRGWKSLDQASWLLWLATDTYDHAPMRLSNDHIVEGTKAPISTFTSPWVGKSLEECGQWLKGAGDRAAFCQKFFAAIDEYSKADGTIQLCRIVPAPNHPDSITVKCYPIDRELAAQHFFVLAEGDFEQRLASYQLKQLHFKKPDRSKGKPYLELGKGWKG